MGLYDLKIAEEVFGKKFEKDEKLLSFLEEKGLEDSSVKKFLDIHQKIWRKESVANDCKKYSETWEDATDTYLERVKKCLEGTENNRFSIEYIAEVVADEFGEPIPNENQGKRQIISLHGGKNGDGKWNEYLTDMLSIFNKLTDKAVGGFNSAYLINWDVDVADDVFYIYIGIN